MARLNTDNVARARELMALYPETRSALIPILHVAQEQDGWLTPDAMVHVAELLGLTPAEVLGTASFYDMLFTHPVGKYLVSVCTNIACLLNGGYELLEHAEEKLGVKAGATTPDGLFTLEEVECIALCGDAPCLAVNWRFRGNVDHDGFDQLVDDLADGRLGDEIPPHGTLSRVRRVPALAAGSGGGGGEVGDLPTVAAPDGAVESDAPQPSRNTGREQVPTGGQDAMAKAAKEVDEITSSGGSADDDEGSP